MTVTKINEYNFKLGCNYMELTAIDYSLSYVKKIILEKKEQGKKDYTSRFTIHDIDQ